MITRPRTFEHFPDDIKCPVCDTNEDAECILVRIDGSTHNGGNICEGQPIHLWCAVVTNYNKGMNVLYRSIT